MTDHERTWLRWLEEVSPIGGVVTNVTRADRQLLAAALAMAAPQGPSGVPCDETDCELHGERALRVATRLAAGLTRGRRLKTPIAQVVARLREAVAVDLIGEIAPEALESALLDLEQSVSARASAAAHARGRMPATWREILRIVEVK